MEITKREILASITIVAVLILLGLFIGDKINQSHLDKIEKYDKAIHITNSDEFDYSIKTSVGYTLSYGDMKAIDTVSYKQIKGEYSYIERVKEHHTMHTETYTTTDSKGHTHTHTRTYWSWDEVDSDEKYCKEVTYLDYKLPSNKFNLSDYMDYIDTVKIDSNDRYVFNGTNNKLTGTLFANCINSKTTETHFYNNQTIQSTLENVESNTTLMLFWFFWIIFIVAIVIGFYYLDNYWLE